MTSLWIVATLMAAAAQTARNAMQSSLTAALGTIGATQVRFLYGFPFALVFLGVVTTVAGTTLPPASTRFVAFALGGSVAQILGTALLLAAMRERSFSVVTAFTKTEAVQVAVFGLLVLGDVLTPMRGLAILIATAGVFIVAVTSARAVWTTVALRPALYGIASGGCFALAAVGFRGAILALGDAPFFLRATTTLAWTLGLQTAMLGCWLVAFDRTALAKSLALWRQSLFAGFMGACASQCWFLGFSLTTAANVRTLGLVEVLFAQVVSRRVFAQNATMREILGMALVVIGVGLLLVNA